MRLVANVLFGASIAVLVVVNGCGGKQIETGGGGSGGADGSEGSGGSSGSSGSGGSLGSGGSGGSLGSDGSGSSDAGGSGGSAGSDGFDAGPPYGCPTDQPLAGDVCSPSSLACEYGTSPNPYCNVLWECNSGSWLNEGVIPGTCPHGIEACPASYGSNAKCTEKGTTCPYSEGTCICSNLGPSWKCVPTSTGCSATRPRVGSPCNHDNQACDYGGCYGGAEMRCVDGFWEIGGEACG
jgi:hypothetical protein